MTVAMKIILRMYRCERRGGEGGGAEHAREGGRGGEHCTRGSMAEARAQQREAAMTNGANLVTRFRVVLEVLDYLRFGTDAPVVSLAGSAGERGTNRGQREEHATCQNDLCRKTERQQHRAAMLRGGRESDCRGVGGRSLAHSLDTD